MTQHILQFFFFSMQLLLNLTPSMADIDQRAAKPNCRSYCGNLTVDYPLGLKPGCGHRSFRDLLFCVNDVLMFHIPSGSYRVLAVDYAYSTLTLHDPAMATCASLSHSTSAKANGFVVEPWRAPYLSPAPDNLFMLIDCKADSPLFQGFPNKHLPCRNVSGMGCADYYACPAWDGAAAAVAGEEAPPRCCGVSFGAIKAINLSRLECEGYSSVYSVAPLRLPGASEWSYGIRVGYSVPAEEEAFCRGCQATGGACGHDGVGYGHLCLCPGGWNSTSDCDHGELIRSFPPKMQHSNLNIWKD